MKNIIDLTGKTILVTGASSGIGRQTCITASQVGAKILAVGRNRERLDETLSQLEGKGHRSYEFDLDEIDAIEEFVKGLVAENGPISGFVNCAGISKSRAFRTCRYDKIQEHMLINFYSFSELCRCILEKDNYLPTLSIITVSSAAAVRGCTMQVPYSASKAAGDAMVRDLSREYAFKGVRANSILVGMVNTPMTERAHESEEYGKNLLLRQYLGWGEPEDASNIIAFLLSDASKFITGATIPVDGGYCAG